MSTHRTVPWLIAGLAFLLLWAQRPVNALPAAPTAEFLYNTSFEVDGWWWMQGDTPATYSANTSHESARSALAGYSETDRCGVSTVSQGLYIVPEATAARLRFWSYLRSEEAPADSPLLAKESHPLRSHHPFAQSMETCDSSQDDRQGAYVWNADFSQSWPLWEARSNFGATQGWTRHEVDLTPWKGQAIWVAFGAFNNGNGQRTWMYVDDVGYAASKWGTVSAAFLPMTANHAPPTPTPSPTSTVTPVPPPPAPTATTPADLGGSSPSEQATIALINQYRENHGLWPLQVASELIVSSRRHSRDMINMGDNPWHTGTDGSDVGSRMRDAGYNWIARAEIIGWGFTTPTAMMNWWVNSPVHNSMILSSNFRDMGAGHIVQPGSRWTNYWTVNFGTRAGPGHPTGSTDSQYRCVYTTGNEEAGSSLILYSSEPCENASPSPRR